MIILDVEKTMLRLFLVFLLTFSGLKSIPVYAADAAAPASPAPEVEPKEAVLLQQILIQGNSISIKTNKPTPYNIFKLSKPSRIVVELTNTEDRWKKRSVSLKNNPSFVRVRSGQYQIQPAKIARVVIELKAPAEYEASAQAEMITLTAKLKEEAKMNPEPEMASKEEPTAQPVQHNPGPVIESANPHPPVRSLSEPETVESVPPAASAGAAGRESDPEEIVPVSQEPKAKAPSLKKDSLSASSDPTSLFGRQTVTLEFYEIDVRDLFKILGEKAGVNIIYGNEVTGSTSIALRDVPFKDAVDATLALTNLKMVVLGRNILQVLTPKEFDDYRIKAISATRLFPINYAKASDVNTQLTSILATLGGKGKTIVDDRTNAIIVTDTPDGIDQTSQLIMDLDKPTPQVIIEAKIVQISLGKNLDLGIAWGAAYTDQSGNQMVTIGAAKAIDPTDAAGVTFPGSKTAGLQTRSPLNPSGGSGLELGGAGFSPASGLGLAFGFVKDSVRLNATLSALAQKKKSKILSNPKVATLNNQAAIIKSEVSEPYITKEVSFSQGQSVTAEKVNTSKSGISLTVTPTINADGRITMKILPDVTTSQPTSIGVPKTTSQQANTTVIVKDGETFVIGGLISELESDDSAYIPILGSIPIIGHLFKKTSRAKTRAELLVFVTPRIIPF